MALLQMTGLLPIATVSLPEAHVFAAPNFRRSCLFSASNRLVRLTMDKARVLPSPTELALGTISGFSQSMLPFPKLGFCGTRFAAASQLSSFPTVGKMAGRDVQSKVAGSSANRKSGGTDNNQGPPSLWATFEDSYEEEFPSLSASVTSRTKGKRISGRWIPFDHSSEQKQNETEKNVTLQNGRSTSTSPKRDRNFHTKIDAPVGKKPWHHGKTMHSPMPSKDVIKNEPFDICFPKTRQPVSPGSFVVKEYVGDCTPRIEEEIQPFEENEKTKDNDGFIQETGQVLRPGMVLFKGYLSLKDQVSIVKTCQELGRGPGGFYQPGYKDGAKLRLYMMCLGLDWDPETRKYGQIRRYDNVAPPALPGDFISLVCKVLEDSHTLIKQNFQNLDPMKVLPTMSPDLCLVNYYTTAGRLGLHQDKDETLWSLRKGLPVVSVSIGDSAEFCYGDERDSDQAESVVLESGDVLIFGGESRHVFHGVKSIIRDTAPPGLRKITTLKPGRLNLTFRKY